MCGKLDKVNDVVILENFLLDEEIKKLNSQIDTTVEWKNKDSESNVKVVKVEDRELSWKISNRVKKIFKSEHSMQIVNMIHKTDESSYWEEHSDNSGDEETKLIIYGVIIYINDNYEGGELIYPDLNFKVKPKSGMLVYHPGNYRHYVSKVKKGQRYSLTTFIRNSNTISK